MGLGQLLTRNLTYDVTNTVSGETGSFTIVTDGGPGAFASWDTGAYRGLMSIPAAWRGMLLLSGLLGKVPWHAYRELGDRPPVKLSPTPMLLASPNGDEIALNTHRSWGLDRLAHGNGIGIIAARGADGWPTGATGVSAENVQVRRAGGSDVPGGFGVGELVYRINGRNYHARDVIHFKGPSSPGELRGWGIIEQHFKTMERTRKLDDQAATVDAAGVPTGLLKSLDPDMTQTEADDLKAAWHRAQATRSVAVLNPGVEFEPIAWNPSEVQLLEMRKYSINEWSNILGVDAMYLAGENSSRVYANLEDKGIDLLRYGTAGDLIAEWEQTLSAQLPRGTRVRANLDFQLRPDTAARYQAHAIGIAAGFLTPNEARELEERPPLTPAQQAEIVAARPAPAGGQSGPSTAPAGKGSASAPGSGPAGQVAAAGKPRLTAVRGLLERLEPIAAIVPGEGLASDSPGWDEASDPIIASYDAADVLGSHEILVGLSAADLDGHDRTADLSGHNLHEYWTAGPGLARWRGSPTPWRTLRSLLAKYIKGNKRKLDSTTSAWYRDVFGHLPGQK